MDRLTLCWVVLWGICVACPLFIAWGTVTLIHRWLRARREDREYATGVAARVRDRAYLDWLEGHLEGSDLP